MLATLLCLPLKLGAQWSAHKEFDKISGLKIHRITTPANENTRYNFRNKYLIIQCHEQGNINVLVDWNDYLGSGIVPVEYRIDEKPSENVDSSASTDGTATFLPATNMTIPQLIAGTVFVVRARDYRGTPTETGTFSLIGFTKAFADACAFHDQYASHTNSTEYRNLVKDSQDRIKNVLQSNQISYVGAIAKKIKRNWKRPAGTSESCKIEIEQSNSGEVLSVSSIACGGEANVLYQSAVRAVTESVPLPNAGQSDEFQSKIRITFK